MWKQFIGTILTLDRSASVLLADNGAEAKEKMLNYSEMGGVFDVQPTYAAEKKMTLCIVTVM